MWHDSGLYSLSNIAPFMICRVHIEKKLPMVTIECSSANTSSNATLMVFVKAKKGLRTNSFISRTPWTCRGLRSLAAAAAAEIQYLRSI
jgi:hypothetical protein